MPVNPLRSSEVKICLAVPGGPLRCLVNPPAIQPPKERPEDLIFRSAF